MPTMCKGQREKEKGKKIKFECKKCGLKSHKKDTCCKPVKIIKAA